MARETQNNGQFSTSADVIDQGKRAEVQPVVTPKGRFCGHCTLIVPGYTLKAKRPMVAQAVAQGEGLLVDTA